MDSKRMKLLERAYEAEVSAALGGHQLHLMQTKAALAETMVEEGYLAKCKVKVSGATVDGYELTHVGRMAYVEKGLSSFHTADEVYDGLKRLWARVQGARGGKKRTLTSEQARAMAAKRHGKK